MRAAAISKLKASLSEYIGFVKAGEEVLVTERGKSVARIVPVNATSEMDSRRMDLAKRGILRPGKGRISADILDSLPIVALPLDVVLQAIDEDREETD